MKQTAILLIGLSLGLSLLTQAADNPTPGPGPGQGPGRPRNREPRVYKVDATKLPPASTKKDVTYEKDIQPLMEKSCVKCHSGDRPKGRFKADTLEGVLKGGGDGKALIAGKSAESPIVGYAADLVPEMEMPPVQKRAEFPALTKEQVGLLRAWIDQGAK